MSLSKHHPKKEAFLLMTKICTQYFQKSGGLISAYFLEHPHDNVI